MSLLIQNGRLIDPANKLDEVADLYIADGKIVAIGESTHSFSADTTIDATDLIVCPGLVDLSVWLPEPGYEYKGSVASETRAAAAGGVTSLCCTPNTRPVVDSPSVATLIQELAKEHNHARVFPLGATTQGLAGKQLSEMHALKKAGCAGVTNLRHDFDNNRVLLHSLEYAATLNITVFFNSVDNVLAEEGCVHAGRYSTHLGLAGIPASAETVALARDLLLVEQTGVRAHFGQLSTARAVELIADAQARGLPVTADVAMHQLILTDASIQGFNGLYHTQPPLRSETDRNALREGVKSGVISAICSHHQPHEIAAKMAPFADTEPGISSIETMLSQGLRLVDEGGLNLYSLISSLTLEPAQIARLDAGTLTSGQAADLCIFDANQEWELNKETMHSQGRNTPYLGERLKGKVRYTFLEGRKVHQA